MAASGGSAGLSAALERCDSVWRAPVSAVPMAAMVHPPRTAPGPAGAGKGGGGGVDVLVYVFCVPTH